MRVLVSGHQGYLGTVMVPILREAGRDVAGLDSGYFAECVLKQALGARCTGMALRRAQLRCSASRGRPAAPRSGRRRVARQAGARDARD